MNIENLIIFHHDVQIINKKIKITFITFII